MKPEGPASILGFAQARQRAPGHIALPVCVFLLALGFYWFNLHLFAPAMFTHSGNVIGDPNETVGYMRKLTFAGDMLKHTLFSATTAPLVSVFQRALRLSQDESLLLVLALVAALNITGTFLLLRSLLASAGFALLFASIFAFFFFNLVLFSIPETYALSDLYIVVYLSFLLRAKATPGWRTGLGLSFLAGLASLYNPPLLSLILIQIVRFFDRSRIRSWLGSSLASLALGGVLFLSINLLTHGSAYAPYVSQYGGKNFSVANLLHPRYGATVFVNFFLYSILAPVGNLPDYLGLQSLAGYLHSPLRGTLLAILEAGVFGGMFMAVARKTSYQRLALGLLVWILLMLVFYTCYTPHDASLWSLQILLPLLIILAIAFKTIQVGPWVKSGAVLLISAMVAVNNCLAFYAGPAR